MLGRERKGHASYGGWRPNLTSKRHTSFNLVPLAETQNDGPDNLSLHYLAASRHPCTPIMPAEE